MRRNRCILSIPTFAHWERLSPPTFNMVGIRSGWLESVVINSTCRKRLAVANGGIDLCDVSVLFSRCPLQTYYSRNGHHDIRSCI